VVDVRGVDVLVLVKVGMALVGTPVRRGALLRTWSPRGSLLGVCGALHSHTEMRGIETARAPSPGTSDQWDGATLSV
jgi:hypothetical protein